MKPRSITAIYDVAGFKVVAERSHDDRLTVRIDDGMRLSPAVARLLAVALTYAAKWAEDGLGSTQPHTGEVSAIPLDNPSPKA